MNLKRGSSRQQEDRNHDRYSDDITTDFRYLTLPKTSLPKVKMQLFGGQPLKWPEWSGFFTATVHNADITESNKKCTI